MSYNKDMNKNTYQGSCKGTRNIKPYDKNQSLLSRVKNAVQGYFIPSWVQAVIPPGTKQGTSNEFADPTENGSMEVSETTETSKPGVGFFQNSSQASGEGITSANLKRRQMDSCSKDDLNRENPASEPQSKRRAIERNVEFVEDDIPSPSFKSTPVARSSVRPLRGSSLAFNLSHTNASKSQDPVVKNSSLFSLSSKLQTPERPVPMSPFYNGPVAYGGANACRQQAQKSFDGTDSEEHQVLISKRNSNLGLSKTTQKILKVLESNKTQHIDKMGLPPLTFDSERHKSLMTEVFSKGRKSAQGPPVKEMSVPTKLNIKPNYALMNSGTSKCNEGIMQDGKSSWTGKMRREREKHHEFRGQDAKTNEVVEKDDLNSLSHIKLPPIALMPLSSASSSISSSFTSSSVRTTAALCTQSSTHTSTGLNKQSSDFKFSLPHFIQEKRRATGNIKSLDMNFKFSEPKSKDSHQSPTPQPITKSLLSGYQIDFTAAVKKSSQAPASEGLLVGPAKDLKTGSVMDILRKDSHSSNTSDSSQSICQGSSLKELFKKSSISVWQCPTCMVSNKMELSVCPCCSTKKPIMSLETPSNSLSAASTTITDISSGAITTLAPPATTSSLVTTSCQPIDPCEPKKTLSLSAMFSAKPGEWNCEVCMVRNKAEVSKCAACETNKPGFKNSEPGPSSLMKDSNQDKWRCDTCKLENSHSFSVCPCCRSSRPKSGEAAEISKMEPPSSLSALFAAKPGEWNCGVCMVRNKADTTKCAACETDKPGTEAAVDNSKKESTETQVVIKAGTGGFTFGSAPTDFFKSEPVKKQDNEATFGGFKPSFECINNATASSSSTGFTAFGGGFKFTPSLSQSACSSNSVIQSLPSTSANPSAVAAPSFKTNFNGQLAFSSEQSTKTTSKEENLNNSNSLFASSKIKAVDGVLFGSANKELKSSVASPFQFGSNTVSKDSSNNAFGLLSPQSAALASAPASANFFNTSASGFKTANEKLSLAQFGSSSNASAPTASLFGQNAVSGSNPSLPMFGHSSIVSGTTIVSNSPSAITFGQNLIDTNSSRMGNTPALPVFEQTSTVSNTNVATNIHSAPMYGQKLTATDTTSTGNTSVLSLFGQTSIVKGTTSVANNPSLTLFGQNLTSTSTVNIGSSPSVPAFAQNLAVSSSSGAFSFGSSPASLFAKPQQNSSNLFGQTSQTSSAFVANTIQTGSGFSFINSDNTTGVFGGTQNSVGNVPNAATFNFGGTRASSNGDDMMMESPQSTLPSFGFNKTSSDSAGFSFGNDNNGSSLFGAANAPTSQGFSFPSVPSSFNFAPANLSTNQQTPQWGQPTNTAQPISFVATPNMNFTAGNVTFSAGGSQGGRVIKKATRRINKR